MPLLADRVRETSTTVGTGTYALAGAVSGYQAFNTAFANGNTVYYVVQAGANWEIGIGTVGTGTLARTQILQSSNADAAVDWPAGTKDVFVAYVADRAVTTSDAATLTNKTIDDYSNNVGANSTHFRIKAGATLAKGDVVKASGFTPGEQAIEVVKTASATDVAIGIVEQALNTGEFGTAVVIGELFNVNTNGLSVGAALYQNGAGGWTTTRPSSGLFQAIGHVVRVNTNNGVISVNIVNPQYVEASANTTNTLVLRDGSGNFAASTVTAGRIMALRTETVDYSVQTTDEVILANAASGTQTITLPSATGNTGRSYLIKRLTASGAATINVTGTGGQTIDGAASVALPNQYDAVRVISTGTAWVMLTEVSSSLILEA